jgi:hypothetical protein
VHRFERCGADLFGDPGPQDSTAGPRSVKQSVVRALLLLPELLAVEGAGGSSDGSEQGQSDQGRCDSLHGSSPCLEADVVGLTTIETPATEKNSSVSRPRDDS